MSAVDVLARLDRAIAACEVARDEHGEVGNAFLTNTYQKLVDEARSERAAISELIDKADSAATVLSNLIAAGQVDARYSGHVTDLTAALARVHPMSQEQQAEQAGVRG